MDFVLNSLRLRDRMHYLNEGHSGNEGMGNMVKDSTLSSSHRQLRN